MKMSNNPAKFEVLIKLHCFREEATPAFAGFQASPQSWLKWNWIQSSIFEQMFYKTSVNVLQKQLSTESVPQEVKSVKTPLGE